jgi:hypothetical protein
MSTLTAKANQTEQCHAFAEHRFFPLKTFDNRCNEKDDNDPVE